MDMGTREGTDALANTRTMDTLLKNLHFQSGIDYKYYEHLGAAHNESFWSQRIHMPLLFFFQR